MSLPNFIEIETSKYCNRRCSWCPVGEYKTRSKQELMDWALFTKIIRELKSLNYDQTVALHNYNEPLSNPRITEELNFLSLHLPNAKTTIFSNGDYLVPPYKLKFLTRKK